MGGAALELAEKDLSLEQFGLSRGLREDYELSLEVAFGRSRLSVVARRGNITLNILYMYIVLVAK